ncbi:hypothetical protein PO878_13525 [Iamia majanohamensis]|uniref:Uncharacterized protein n=1 Tax=Iamia majanohamensis TaxID=467976 RepID=A0AAE9Y6Z5_9ACTN|nr:hypothetical protein [Iamia majanohamensis]WCO65518.1 hypothetical protein PO878_13525 [Iamia majanohamensis]
MPDAPAPTPLDALDGDLVPGVTGRGLLTGVALASEGLRVAKLAGTEVLAVADATADRTFDVLDELADELAGPFAPMAKAPTSIGRAAFEAGSTGARRVLATA